MAFYYFSQHKLYINHLIVNKSNHDSQKLILEELLVVH